MRNPRLASPARRRWLRRRRNAANRVARRARASQDDPDNPFSFGGAPAAEEVEAAPSIPEFAFDEKEAVRDDPKNPGKVRRQVEGAVSWLLLAAAAHLFPIVTAFAVAAIGVNALAGIVSPDSKPGILVLLTIAAVVSAPFVAHIVLLSMASSSLRKYRAKGFIRLVAVLALIATIPAALVGLWGAYLLALTPGKILGVVILLIALLSIGTNLLAGFQVFSILGNEVVQEHFERNAQKTETQQPKPEKRKRSREKDEAAPEKDDRDEEKEPGKERKRSREKDEDADADEEDRPRRKRREE